MFDTPGKETFFAKPDRTSGSELIDQANATLSDPFVRIILDAVQGYLMVLNSNRQILAANSELLQALGYQRGDSILGLRPGEALNCVHFTDGPNGCGTGEHCRCCGAVLAILASQKKQERAVDECRLSFYKKEELAAMEYRVIASPLKVNGEILTTLVLTDITSEKRREVLEQTFLHDLLNSLGGIEGWSQLLRELSPQLAAEKIMSLAGSLREEVMAHRILTDAEHGELQIQKQPCRTHDLLQALENTFESHPVRAEKQLIVEAFSPDAILMTDRALLSRVLVNMVKNAFEATPSGACVKVWFELQGERPAFLVENEGIIPEPVRPHIFERAFSTKANKGRGIGTYSMKLLGERFLEGSVGFSCATGTTRFWIILPPETKVEAAVRAQDKLANSGPAPESGSARRILFAEDDHSLARLGSLFLKRIGCVVTTCRNGTEAAEAFEASPETFDLVITDAQMPGLDGFELVQRIHKIRPGIPVLLCTGSHVSNLTLDEYGFRGVLLKPYSAASFSEALDTILAKSSSTGSGT